MAKSIFEHQTTTIPANQTVDDVIVIGGDALVLGSVANSVVIVNGDVHLGSTSQVKGFVFVIGGKVQQDAGSVINGDVISISLDDTTQNSLLIGGGLVLGIWVIQLAGSLIMILIPLLMILFGKQRTTSFIEKHRFESMGKLIYTGLFSGMILIAVCLLLLLTVIGIPFILLIGLIIFVAFAFGMTTISYLIADRVQGTLGKADWIKATLGAFILTSSVNIPILGLLVLVVIFLFSFGVATIWFVEKVRNKKRV
jgi:hypothetical protein